MLKITTKGDLNKTNNFLKKLSSVDIFSSLNHYGELGVFALSKATPVSSSLTSNSWAYRIIKGKRYGIEWYNTNAENGVSVAVLIQYGHATRSGGYIQGIDYINPSIKPVFDKILEDFRKKVKYE